MSLVSPGDSGIMDMAQHEEKTYALGSVQNPHSQFTVQRFDSNGRLDTDFASAGTATTDFNGLDSRPQTIFVGHMNKITAVGYASNGTNNNFALVRWDEHGNLDNTFGD